MATMNTVSRSEIKSTSELIYREPRSENELIQLLQLRYDAFQDSAEPNALEPSSGLGYNLDWYDAYSLHFGFYLRTDGVDAPVGYHRIVEDDAVPDQRIVEIARRNPTLSRALRPRPAPLPVMEYWPDSLAIRRVYDGLKAEGYHIVEGSRLSLLPEFRSLRVVTRLLHAEIANVGFHRRVGMLFTAVTTAHGRFYQRLGFRRVAGTEDQELEIHPGTHCCLLARPQWLPESWIPRLREMASEFASTGEIRLPLRSEGGSSVGPSVCVREVIMMSTRLIPCVAIPFLIFVAPVLASPDRLAHPAPWLGFVLATITLVSQPPIGVRQMVSDSRDRLSALGIFLGVIGAQLAGVLDFAFRPAFGPLPTHPLVIVGCSIAISGMGLRLWSIRTLGPLFTSTVTVQDGQRIIERGPYAMLRHPSYTGVILTGIGVTTALGSALGLALVFALAVPSYLYRIFVEEKALNAALGRDYQAYTARTWALLPYVF